MKVLVGADDDRILGFTMIGADAGEVVAAIQTAMLAGLPYPKLRDAVQRPTGGVVQGPMGQRRLGGTLPSSSPSPSAVVRCAMIGSSIAGFCRGSGAAEPRLKVQPSTPACNTVHSCSVATCRTMARTSGFHSQLL